MNVPPPQIITNRAIVSAVEDGLEVTDYPSGAEMSETAREINTATDVWVRIPATAGPWATWLWLQDLTDIQETIVRAASGDTEDDTE